MKNLADEIVLVNVLNKDDVMNAELSKRPKMSDIYTKLHCWRLMQFSKAVFMDADTLVSVE